MNCQTFSTGFCSGHLGGSGTSVMFVMNGRPLERDGNYACFRRVPAKGELRSNLHVAGTAVKMKVTDKMLAIAERVRPKLVQDGIFLVGLDIVGDKIVEINVFTPGLMPWPAPRATEVECELLARRYESYVTGRITTLSLTATTPGVTSAATRAASFSASELAMPQMSTTPF